MVCPDYFVTIVGDVETDFTHTIHVRECVPPIVILFYGCVPEVIKVGLKVRGTFVSFMCVIKVTANVTICHRGGLLFVYTHYKTLSRKIGPVCATLPIGIKDVSVLFVEVIL